MSKPAIQRYFFDTEFEEKPEGLAEGITFVSVGIVSEFGEQDFYGVSREFNEAAIQNQWVLDNVISKLPSAEQRQTIEEIRAGILNVLKPAKTVELWAKNGSYDNVLLCRLFGGMAAFRKTCNEHGIDKVVFRDINELERAYPVKHPKIDDQRAHIAIEDARREREKYVKELQYVGLPVRF
ncbi:MAG: 3'-5' exoribonuclease [Alphaproteobacteria bacterium]|nr:3'-5' exoribonuclease [Alphaproteobacteria bacterium]